MLSLLGTILSQPRANPGGIRGYYGIRHGGYGGYRGYRGYKGYRGPTYNFGIHTGGYGGARYGK